MALRTKTVEYAFPALASLANNTLSAVQSMTIFLPEGSKTFRKVIAFLSADGLETAAGNITARRLDMRLGAAGFTSHNNANLYTGSGENIVAWHALDMTAHFAANWTGTSMTLDYQALLNGSGTGAAWANVCVTVYISYEFDDASATQVKTVRIPLDAPVGAVGTTQPGTAVAVIPNLSTELPEASKVFRNSFVTVQGNLSLNTATTDSTLSLRLGTTATVTTGLHEGGLASDKWIRYVMNTTATLTTAAAQDFFMWGSVARYNHMQAWLTVTYEFDATAANDTFISLMLPMEITSPMGGTTSADYQRGDRELWIQEPGTIVTKQIAFFPFWDQAANIGGLNMRVGTGGFVTYTDTASTLCGGNGAMVRNDAAFTLTRGRNVLNFDAYRTDTADLGFNFSGFWIVNYTCAKPTQGYAAANRTILWNLGATFDGAAAVVRDIAATAPNVSSSAYFLNAIGTNYRYVSNTTGNPAGVGVLVERTAAEGGLIWEPAYVDIGHTDPETGLRQCWSQVRTLFRRWPNDPGTDRMDFETSRRWRCVLGNNCLSFDYLDLIFTYHNITYTVSGNITGSAGGTVNIDLHRASSGEKVLSTSRVGNGAFSFTWYDNTEQLYVVARESDTLLGRSDNSFAT